MEERRGCADRESEGHKTAGEREELACLTSCLLVGCLSEYGLCRHSSAYRCFGNAHGCFNSIDSGIKEYIDPAAVEQSLEQT